MKGTLSELQLSGATFSLSNIGMYFTALLKILLTFYLQVELHD